MGLLAEMQQVLLALAAITTAASHATLVVGRNPYAAMFPSFIAKPFHFDTDLPNSELTNYYACSFKGFFKITFTFLQTSHCSCHP